MKNTFSRIKDAFHVPDRQQIIRNYLDQSVSMTDLERRQREIQQGKFGGF